MGCHRIRSGRKPSGSAHTTHRTDTGTYLVSRYLVALIYVKDEEGLYTADPKKDKHATFIPEITVAEL
ncbi:MAG: hypothetical protein R3A45_08135 [Bdellovibrionota bacterium]